MPSLPRTILLGLSAALLGGCTQIGLFLANVPAHYDDDEVQKDVSYGPAPENTLDLYIPKAADKPAPVLVFFYGGRWSEGRKEQYRFLADSFTAQGYIVAIPDYRKYPQVKFPAFVEDGAAAIAWLHDNAQSYGGDPQRILLMGHSAGAHIAALLATDPHYLGAHNLERSTIKAFAGLSGPYAFEPKAPDLKDMFGPPERYPQMRAHNFVDGRQPPMLLIHGLKDSKVLPANSRKLKQTIDEKGGTANYITYEGFDHIDTIGAFMWFWPKKSDIKEQVTDFFDKESQP